MARKKIVRKGIGSGFAERKKKVETLGGSYRIQVIPGKRTAGFNKLKSVSKKRNILFSIPTPKRISKKDLYI